MYIPRFLVILILITILGSVGWISAQPRTSVLSSQDLHEIEQLVEGYHRGIDIGPEDASWVFAEDAVFEYSAGSVIGATVSGSHELKKFYAERRQTNTARHLISNVVIKPTPNGATGSLYMTTLNRTDDSPVTVTAFGIYEDIYAKTAAGWRIKRRVYTQQLPPAQAQ